MPQVPPPCRVSKQSSAALPNDSQGQVRSSIEVESDSLLVASSSVLQGQRQAPGAGLAQQRQQVW